MMSRLLRAQKLGSSGVALRALEPRLRMSLLGVLALMGCSDAREDFPSPESQPVSQGSVASAEGAVKSIRGQVESLLRQGLALEAEGKSEAAVETFLAGLELEPLVELHKAIAQSYESLRNVEKARHHLREVVRLEPESAVSNYKLGMLMVRTEGGVQAAKPLSAAVELSEAGDEVYYLSLFNLGVHAGEQLKEPAKAEEYVRRSLEAEEEHPEALRYLGLLLQRREEYAAAADLYRKALVLAPDHGRTIYYLGFCYYHLGDREGLEAQFRRLTVLGAAPARRLERLLEQMDSEG